MKTFRLVNQTRANVVAEQCEIADNLFTRVRGLLGRDGLEEGSGLLIVPCPSIHMFGMKFALDVIFLSRENVVVDWIENIAPGAYYVAQSWTDNGQKIKAHAAVELPVGTIARVGIERGDQFVREA